MSRKRELINDRFAIIYGTDHALGFFVQVTDIDFAEHEKDFSGEGYVFDWDMMFGTTVSHIKNEKGAYKPNAKEKPFEIIKTLKKDLISGKIFNKHINQ